MTPFNELLRGQPHGIYTEFLDEFDALLMSGLSPLRGRPAGRPYEIPEIYKSPLRLLQNSHRGGDKTACGDSNLNF